MNYFILNNERNGTCYHEFQQGAFADDYWRDDSIYLDDDLLDRELYSLISSAVEYYDCYGITVITRRQWSEICRLSEDYGKKTAEIIAEADVWAQKNFEKNDAFTILGI